MACGINDYGTLAFNVITCRTTCNRVVAAKGGCLLTEKGGEIVVWCHAVMYSRTVAAAAWQEWIACGLQGVPRLAGHGCLGGHMLCAAV
jgi:hypothetical protein